VVNAGGVGDMGTAGEPDLGDAGADMGMAGAPADLATGGGAHDLGVTPPHGKSGGCGCTLTGSSAFEMTPFALLGLLLLVFRASRRRSS
jgi:MYXO-CTERM domain-containing protein